MPDFIKENITLAPYTTFKVGGAAEYFAEIKTMDQLQEALLFADREGLSVTVLGDGSNVVVSDDGVSGLVLVMKNEEITFENDAQVRVGAGMNWDEFVQASIESNLWGIENLSGIPGSVGAVPVQNVGAYGTEVAEVIAGVKVIHKKTGELRVFTSEECNFGYRDSFFKSHEGRAYIIYEVVFQLKSAGEPQLRYKDLKEYFGERVPGLDDIREAVLEIRSKKFPDLTTCGTAGSFFKNPVVAKEVAEVFLNTYPDAPAYEAGGKTKLSAAWLIDKAAGLRGVSHGSVGTHENQALVMVNHGGASASDIKQFAEFVIEEVKNKTGIVLEPEVRFVG